jgi:hypothetical protein
MNLLFKDPDSRVDYLVDWGAAHLGANSITASQWSVHPQHDAGLAVVAHRHDARTTTVSLEGGRAGMVYDVTNRVSLSNGELDERSLSVRVEQR